MMRVRWIAVVALGVALPAQAQSPSAILGTQRAAASKLEWEIRDAGHPALGPIRYAVVKTAVETPVGNAKVYSRAYVSCQTGLGKIAIELTNTSTPADSGGLRPKTLPRLVCHRPVAAGSAELAKEDLFANWKVSEIGDALTRDFRPFPLRECVAIAIEQEVELPEGWARKSTRVEFEIFPYGRELDSVFAACGEPSAYATATAVAAAPRVATPAAPQAADASQWRTVRTLSSGKTNVRAGPNLQSAVVVRLDPGAVILVQPASAEWWRAKARSGAPFEGYVRTDRLVAR